MNSKRLFKNTILTNLFCNNKHQNVLFPLFSSYSHLLECCSESHPQLQNLNEQVGSSSRSSGPCSPQLCQSYSKCDTRTHGHTDRHKYIQLIFQGCCRRQKFIYLKKLFTKTISCRSTVHASDLYTRTRHLKLGAAVLSRAISLNILVRNTSVTLDAGNLICKLLQT